VADDRERFPSPTPATGRRRLRAGKTDRCIRFFTNHQRLADKKPENRIASSLLRALDPGF